jgi:tRNA A-37 threonylcarbamoyl transferase component Bud32
VSRGQLNFALKNGTMSTYITEKIIRRKNRTGTLMRECDLPAGYRLMRIKDVSLAVKEEYAEVFSSFALPDAKKAQGEGRQSGRGQLVQLSLTADGVERALVRRSLRGGVLGRLCGEIYLSIGFPRPVKELRVSEYARSHAVQTPEIIAAAVEKADALFYRGAVVTRQIAYGLDLQEAALAYAPIDRESIAEKRRCIDSFGRLIARMHGAGIYHADLHLKNVLKSGDELYLLDLDAARIFGRMSDYRKRANLLRLYRSVQKINRRKRAITRTDLLRFAHSYAAESGRSEKILSKELTKMLPPWRLKWWLSDLMKI